MEIVSGRLDSFLRLVLIGPAYHATSGYVDKFMSNIRLCRSLIEHSRRIERLVVAGFNALDQHLAVMWKPELKVRYSSERGQMRSRDIP